jgi:hypothetical protein
MPELRQDRFTKEWVFVASENITRPQELVVPRQHKSAPSFDPKPVLPRARKPHGSGNPASSFAERRMEPEGPPPQVYRIE